MSKPYREYTEQDIYNLVQEIKKLKDENKILKDLAESYLRDFFEENAKLYKIKELAIASFNHYQFKDKFVANDWKNCLEIIKGEE